MHEIQEIAARVADILPRVACDQQLDSYIDLCLFVLPQLVTDLYAVALVLGAKSRHIYVVGGFAHTTNICRLLKNMTSKHEKVTQANEIHMSLLDNDLVNQVLFHFFENFEFGGVHFMESPFVPTQRS